MKKINSIVMLVAAAAMAFVSCQKQENFAPEVSSEDVVLTFASEKPAFEDETKTEWTGSSIQWSVGDKIAIAYTVAGNWQNASGDADNDAKLYKSESLEETTETAQFNVSTYFTGTTVGSHVFYGVYPAPDATTFNAAPVATLEVPINQTPGSASFDGAADLMTGVSVGEFTSRPASGETISMKWTRLVAHANITLKALNGVTEGETISTITLTAQEGANLVGSQKVNIQTNEVTNNNNESNVIVLNGGNLAVDDSGNIEFWACFLPVTLTSLKVEVETNEAIYTREIDLSANQKTFAKNARNVLSIKMDTATRVAKTVDTSDYSGTYAIIAENSSKFYYLTNVDNGASTKRLNSDAEMTSLPESGVKLDASLVWNIVKNADGTYLIQSAENDLYLDHTSGNSSVLVENVEDAVALTIEETEGKYAISYVDSNSETRNFVKNSSNPYFAFYTSSQCGPVYFVPAEISLTPVIIVADEDLTQSVDAEATELTFNYQVKNITGTPTVTVASEPVSTMTNVSATAADGVVTVKFDANTAETAKSATITLSYEGATSVNVVINQAAKAAAGTTEKTWSWDGGGKSDFTSLSGVSASGLGSDYAASHAPYRLKLDTTSDYFVVPVDGAVKTVSVGVKMVGGATTSYLDIQGSSDGTSFTSVEQLTISGEQNAVLELTTSKSFDPSYRYVKFYFTKGSNVGVGPISITYITEDGGETPVVPVQLTMSDITCSAQTENSLTFTWPAVANASKYEVTFNNGTAEEVTTTSYTATGLTASTSYTISVKAVGDGTNYTTSEAKTQTGTTGGGNEDGGTSYSLLWSDTATSNGYTTTESSITASDGSEWAIKGYLRNSTNQFIQLGKGGANYITTPNMPAPITKITVVCGSSYYLTVCTIDGTELMNKQPGGGSSSYENVVEFDLSSYSYSQVKLISRRASGTSNAAVYIQSVVVE